ncbi:hypothetical protein [Pseudonocardia sp. KRD291]|uniref:hypothetical protein n=1 Tax=Pseudonocardia sp. KRD291 TaxID=2792007 RepID=UPI001C4A0F2F|nr:hypothetical protein [Pseudonocardia sp. KRD291]MBW0106055.1 hypothetical protein [Pseudonocardia sp. KRD291]
MLGADLPLYDAVERIFERRHQLTGGEVLALQEAWCCASAARWGAPYERFWEFDLDAELAEHDLTECEDPDPWAGIEP